MARIGFIGTGHIAAPMVKFLSARGHDITVSARNAQTSELLARTHGVVVRDNQSVVEESDVVFLCVRPHVAESVIGQLKFRAGQKIVSVMAGVLLEQLGRLCAPSTNISVMIPLGYLERGGCPLAVCPDGRTVAQLFEPENPVSVLADETAFNMHFAVCAFVPGILDLMTTASKWLAGQGVDADGAARYTQQLVSGFLAALPEGTEHLLAQERDALATDGTLSLMMTTALRSGGAHKALEAALDSVGQRLSPGAD